MNAAPSPCELSASTHESWSGCPSGISRAIRVATVRAAQSSSSTRGGDSWRIRIRPAPSAHTASTCGSSRGISDPLTSARSTVFQT